MRAKVSGWSKRRGPAWLDQRGRLLVVGDARRRAAQHVADLLLGEAGAHRRPQGEQQGAGLLPVRVIRCVQHLPGRDAAEHVQEVDRAPDRGVEIDARSAGEAFGEGGEIGDAGMRDDQGRLGVGVVEPAEVVGDRRQAAPAVDEDGDAPLGGEREDRLEPLVVQEEALRPRVELDPARPQIEAPCRLLDRLLRQVEPDEGDEEALGALGGRERAVVRGPEGGLAVGLVEAEGERALDPPASQEVGQLLERGDHPVNVPPDVNVGVEQLRALGDERARLGLVPVDQPARSFENLVHGNESTRSGYHREPCPTFSSSATPSARPSCATRFRSHRRPVRLRGAERLPHRLRRFAGAAAARAPRGPRHRAARGARARRARGGGPQLARDDDGARPPRLPGRRRRSRR